MDLYLASYLLLFATFLGVDLGVFSSSEKSDDDDDEDDEAESSNRYLLYDPSHYGREVHGTEGHDTLSAAEAEEDLAWFLSGGSDLLIASDGSDRAEGGAGNDDLRMRGGDDIALGGDGDDDIDGGIGFDQLDGQSGNDMLDGNGGQDTLHGGAGNDTVLGGSGADLLHGGAGDDVLSGLAQGLSTGQHATTSDGADTLYGGEGDDTLLLGPGDIGTGGAGNDLFQLDHRRDDLDEVSQITDFTEDDMLEIHYETQRDADGNPVDPTITVETSETGDGGIIGRILFNGTLLAEVTGEQPLTADLILLVPED
ncbi:MAG TPA: hypothetical protein VGA75_01615 [Paracoccaceae bacterium]